MGEALTLEAKIEAVLFWKGEPVSEKELAKLFSVSPTQISEALATLESNLSGRGITLVRNGEAGTVNAEVMLYTAPEAGELIKELTKEELSRDVTKAGVEVLSLIMYRGPIAKRDIDYIRGVNSSFILRNLLVRGLIERQDSKDARSYVYGPSMELLAHLGVSKKEDLPDFTAVQNDIAAFMTREEAKPEQGSDATENNGTN